MIRTLNKLLKAYFSTPPDKLHCVCKNRCNTLTEIIAEDSFVAYRVQGEILVHMGKSPSIKEVS